MELEIKFPLIIFGNRELVESVIRKVKDKYPSVIQMSLPHQMTTINGEIRYLENVVMFIKPETILEFNHVNIGDFRDVRTWIYEGISYDENMNTEELITIREG